MKTQPGGASNKRRRRREVPFMTHPAARRLNKAGGRRHKVPTPCDRWRRVDVPPSGHLPGLSRRPATVCSRSPIAKGEESPGTSISVEDAAMMFPKTRPGQAFH